MVEKREPPFSLDMPFAEALGRFAATRPDEVRTAAQEGRATGGLITSNIKSVSVKNTPHPAAVRQTILDLGVEVQRSVNGIEMGVLENGIPFLTQTGLASASGIARSVIFDIGQDWERAQEQGVISKDRIGWLQQHLYAQGYKEPKLFIETKKDNAVNNAYPDVVCMAIIEYYAFEAKTKTDAALRNFRNLAAFGLQKFIYDALNYHPGDKWQYHHDRVSILKNSATEGYWIIFNEITGLVVDLITADLTVNSKTIPDISVGLAWASYWEDNNLRERYEDRIKFIHDYPSYYPQSASNPQRPWAYPDASLPEFRHWFRHEYLVTKFPKYILTKAHILAGGKDEAKAIGSMYQPKAIEAPGT